MRLVSLLTHTDRGFALFTPVITYIIYLYLFQHNEIIQRPKASSFINLRNCVSKIDSVNQDAPICAYCSLVPARLPEGENTYTLVLVFCHFKLDEMMVTIRSLKVKLHFVQFHVIDVLTIWTEAQKRFKKSFFLALSH